MGWREVIVSLNSLGVGDLESIHRRVRAARAEVVAHGHEELAARLDEALEALGQGRMAEFRRLVNQVVSRLGHLKD